MQKNDHPKDSEAIVDEPSEDYRPSRPPPPKLFNDDDKHVKPVELPQLPEDAPPVVLPKKNPKLYELVNLSQDSSFWWDSVDTNASAEDDLAYQMQANVGIQYSEFKDG